MLARYLEVIDRFRAVAIVHSIELSRVYANGRGQRALGAHRDRLDASFAEVETSQNARVERFGDDVLTVMPLFGDGGKVDGSIAVALEVAGIPKLLHDLQSTGRHFARVIHSLPQIVVTARPHGRVDYVSRRFYEVTSARPGERDPHDALVAALPPDERPTFLETWDRYVRDIAEFTIETRLCTTQGERWFAVHGRPLLEGARVIKWIVAIGDIHDDVLVRTELARSQRRLRLVADIGIALRGMTAPERIARITADRVAMWARGACVVELRSKGVRTALAEAPRDARLLAERVRFALVSGEEAALIPAGITFAPIDGDARAYGYIAFAYQAGASDMSEDARMLADVAERVSHAVAAGERAAPKQRLADGA